MNYFSLFFVELQRFNEMDSKIEIVGLEFNKADSVYSMSP